VIPPFDERGYLPPGIHVATMEEVRQRFGRETEISRAQFESLEWLLPMARRAGIKRLMINGSFVTDEREPNDVDCVLLQGSNFDDGSIEVKELRDGLPFLSLQIAAAIPFEFLVKTMFGTDRHFVPKGMIEVIL